MRRTAPLVLSSIWPLTQTNLHLWGGDYHLFCDLCLKHSSSSTADLQVDSFLFILDKHFFFLFVAKISSGHLHVDSTLCKQEFHKSSVIGSNGVLNFLLAIYFSVVVKWYIISSYQYCLGCSLHDSNFRK